MLDTRFSTLDRSEYRRQIRRVARQGFEENKVYTNTQDQNTPALLGRFPTLGFLEMLKNTALHGAVYRACKAKDSGSCGNPMSSY